MIRFLRKKDYPYRVFLLFFLLFSFAGCSKNFEEYWKDGSTKGGDLFAVLQTKPEFSMFAEAVEYSKLSPFLVKGGSYTVFAPTNEAFTAYLSLKGYASVKDIPRDDLFQLCSYHVVQSMWYYHTLRDRYVNKNNVLYSQGKRYMTRSRKFVDIDVSVADKFTINNIDIIPALKDVDADNGVIHGIPQVLIALPRIDQLFDTDQELANSVFGKMLKVLKDRRPDFLNTFDKDGNGTIDTSYLVSYPLLNGGANVGVDYLESTVANVPGGRPAFTTFIMPNDQILGEHIASALAKANGNYDSLPPSYVEAVLENYVLTDTAMTSDALKARTGGNLILANGFDMLSPLLRNDADFGRKDIVASNGRIHFINAIFRPSPRQQGALNKATEDPDFKLFFAAMQKANLMGNYATNSRNNTYLIPTNAAIIAADLNVEKQTFKGTFISLTQLRRLLEHNIVNVGLTKANLTGVRVAVYGGNLTFSNGGNTVTNDNAVSANVGLQLYNGATDYVYKIDKMLVPIVY